MCVCVPHVNDYRCVNNSIGLSAKHAFDDIQFKKRLKQVLRLIQSKIGMFNILNED